MSYNTNVNENQNFAKEQQVDEMVNKIEEMQKEIVKLKEDLNILAQNTTKKNQEKDDILKKLQVLESAKKEKHRKLEYIKAILRGDENVIPDFRIVPEEVCQFIPETPLKGIESIKDSFYALENILKRKSNGQIVTKNNTEEIKFVNVKYMGENLKYIFPTDTNYTFYQLLEDTASFFLHKELNESDYQNFFFRDELSSFWPLNIPVIEAVNANPNLVLSLTDKRNLNQKNKDDEDNDEEEEELPQVKIEKNINKFLEHHLPKTKGEENVQEVSEEKRRDASQKVTKQNEVILMIEKTFCNKICNLLVYIGFVIYVIYFIIMRYSVESSLELVEVIKTEFFEEEFEVSFNLMDFYTTDVDSTEYKSTITLAEIHDSRLFEHWLRVVFFPKLGFSDGKLQFLERHRLFGPIRFLQQRSGREANPSYLTGHPEKYLEIDKYFPYDALITQDKNSTFLFYEDIQNTPNAAWNEYSSNCKLSNSSLCEWMKSGLKYRELDLAFSYAGQVQDYDINGGYFFDIPFDNYSFQDISKFCKFLSNYWFDPATRLIIISFNSYQAIHDYNRLISINIYIEIGCTGIMKKNIEISLFKLFINFQKLIKEAKTDVFQAILHSLNTFFKEYIYLVFLLIFSIMSLVGNFKRLLREKQAMIGFSIGVLIMAVLVLRIIYTISQYQIVKTFQENEFKNFFPVSYFSEGLQSILHLLEIILVLCITINLINAFYPEFFLRIFLTFAQSLKYLFSFLLVFLAFVFGYALSFHLLFGTSIESMKYVILNFFHIEFQNITVSFTTMMVFIYLDFNDVKLMIELFPVLSRVLIFSYLILIYFLMMNFIFVILLMSYEEVKRKHVLTLLDYKILADGLKQLLINWALKIAKIPKLKELMNNWLGISESTKEQTRY